MKEHNLYKCSICGNISELMHVGGGQMSCCGQPMDLIKENSVEASVEKHIPVVEKTATGFKVKIGETPHPMIEEHYIEWVTVLFDDGKVGHKYFKPGDAPEIEFFMNKLPIKTTAYCNIHGLWAKTS